MATSNREKFAFKNTLLCLLTSLENKYTTVELRNETIIEGKILSVDSGMNIRMANVKLKSVKDKGKLMRFTDFFVQGSMIRFVHIPDEINIQKAIEREVCKDTKHKTKVHADRLASNTKRMERRRQFQKKEHKKKEAATAMTSQQKQPEVLVTKPIYTENPQKVKEYPDIL